MAEPLGELAGSTTEPILDERIAVTVNGEAKRIARASTVAGLIQALGMEGDRVAVELNRVIVRRAAWETTEIAAGAKLEIVHFVGGG